MAIVNPFPNNPWFSQPLQKKAFENIMGKEKILVTSISPFPTVFSAFRKTNFRVSVTLILLSANVFNLDWLKDLLFGKELSPFARV